MRFLLRATVVILSGLALILVRSEYMTGISGAIKDKVLFGYAFRNLTMITALECFMFCQRDRRCVAFQMCFEEEEYHCHLLSSTRLQSPLVAVFGCSYYDTQYVSSKSSCQLELNHCQNGGTAEVISPTDYTTPCKKKCNCLPGYSGNLCEDVVKSCRGYINGSRVPGKYKVFDDTMNLFDVFCDFDLNTTTAWTLVQSYQLQYTANFMKSFRQNNPINENDPRWDSYSLSKRRMETIRDDSSKWRMTCQYDTQGVVYTDYMEGKNENIDIITYVEEYPSFTCFREKHLVEYVDIREQNCKDCTAPIVQGKDNPFHLDTYYSNCEFKPTGCASCDGLGEDNFGMYLCKNPSHRCSSSPTATTQTWLGGQ